MHTILNSFNKKDRILTITIITLVFIAIFFIPENILLHSNRPACLHYKILGIQCPFCGMTRAVYEVLHLHIQEAIKYNFVVLFLFLWYIVEVVYVFFPFTFWVALRKYFVVFIIIAFFVLYLIRIMESIII